ACLAHHGVLFLDELSEFARPSLEALRQPLEDGRVSIVRGQRTCVFPTRFMLVASTNPCPCGFAGDAERCTCSEADIARHRRRLSGPLLDRLDLLVNVQRPSDRDLGSAATMRTEAARERVTAARERQARRLDGTHAACNGHMDSALVRAHARPTEAARQALERSYEQSQLSARGHHRVLRVARTVADLAGSDRIERQHISTALNLRQQQVGEEVPA
ncbi:MAG: magnesium chelatase family protein, partial [Solirubrobacteraceae bacterium]|nr:magnesium chelatase family protein [Solirubrobacteraceae bacterium]